MHGGWCSLYSWECIWTVWERSCWWEWGYQQQQESGKQSIRCEVVIKITKKKLTWSKVATLHSFLFFIRYKTPREIVFPASPKRDTIKVRTVSHMNLTTAKIGSLWFIVTFVSRNFSSTGRRPLSDMFMFGRNRASFERTVFPSMVFLLFFFFQAAPRVYLFESASRSVIAFYKAPLSAQLLSNGSSCGVFSCDGVFCVAFCCC